MRLDLSRLSFALVTLAAFGTVSAAQRTFVASYGNDAEPCSLTQPCRGFQAAINAVAPGGEVVALDSAGYGAMAIGKSVSVIVPPGVHAGLSPTTGIPVPGYPDFSVVLIDIADTDVVVLRGLGINSQGSVTGGIFWVSGHNGTVHVESTTVNGFSTGLWVHAGDGIGRPPRLHVKDSILRANSFAIGFRSDYVMDVVIDQVRIEQSSFAGIYSEGPIAVDVRNSVIAGNVHGIDSRERNAKAANYALESCMLSQNDVAFHFSMSPGVASGIDVSGSLYSDNGKGYVETSANQNVRSRGNNTVLRNGASCCFNSTFPPQ